MNTWLNEPDPQPPTPPANPNERRNMKKYLIVAVILALLVIAGLAYWLSAFR